MIKPFTLNVVKEEYSEVELCSCSHAVACENSDTCLGIKEPDDFVYLRAGNVVLAVGLRTVVWNGRVYYVGDRFAFEEVK